MPKYSMGFDFGSLSVRGLLVDVDTGEEISTAVYEYPHGIMEDFLPDGTIIPNGFALQHPQDYLDGISYCSKTILSDAKIDICDVIGVGIDSTASTVVPLDTDRIPLCFNEKFKSNPQSWIKLWKHRGDIPQATRITEAAKEEDEVWLRRRGGILSCEFFLPKALEIAESDSSVYEATDSIIEVADWLTGLLTGTAIRSRALAEANGCFIRGKGYPSDAFFKKVSEGGSILSNEKLWEPLIPLEQGAGVLGKEGAQLLGLCEGISVSLPIPDAHASVCASGAHESGDMVYICGTSAVELLLTDHVAEIPGIHISGQDLSIPGFCTVGCGQSSVGDSFSWFVSNFVPAEYKQLAKNKNMDIYSLLSEKASELMPGESGLLAMDWWNGARTPFFNFALTGFIFGLNLHTKPEEIWRALFEAHAFNVKRCINLIEDSGHVINRVFATGGIPLKNPILMQILSDVIQKEIYVCKSSQPSALGSAIFGAAIAQKHVSFNEHVSRMSSKPEIVYHPSEKNSEVYNELFELYKTLSEHYGKDSVLLSSLSELKHSVKENK